MTFFFFVIDHCEEKLALWHIVKCDQAWSKRDQADENEVNGVSTRRRKLTEKGRAYRATLLKERREKINGRMMRRCSVIENLLCVKQK